MPVNIVNNTDAIKRQDNITPIEVLLTDDNNANYPIDGKTVKAWFSNETGFLYEKELTERDGQKLIIRIDPDEVDKIGIGKIKMEIVVEESDRQKIFPNGSYIEFEIVRNLKSINGNALNPITLEFFEQEFADLKLVADAATQLATSAAERIEALEPKLNELDSLAERAESAATNAENAYQESVSLNSSLSRDMEDLKKVTLSIDMFPRNEGETDDAPRLNRAIKYLASQSFGSNPGGKIELASDTYRIQSETVKYERYVAISGQSEESTIFEIYIGKGASFTGTVSDLVPAFKFTSACSMEKARFIYPEQLKTNSTPIEYGWLFDFYNGSDLTNYSPGGEFNTDRCRVENIRIDNAFKAFNLDRAAQYLINNIKLQTIYKGFYLNRMFDVSRITNIHSWDFFCTSADNLYNWILNNGITFDIGRVDDIQMQNIFSLHTKHAFNFFGEVQGRVAWGAADNILIDNTKIPIKINGMHNFQFTNLEAINQYSFDLSKGYGQKIIDISGFVEETISFNTTLINAHTDVPIRIKHTNGKVRFVGLDIKEGGAGWRLMPIEIDKDSKVEFVGYRFPLNNYITLSDNTVIDGEILPAFTADSTFGNVNLATWTDGIKPDDWTLSGTNTASKIAKINNGIRLNVSSASGSESSVMYYNIPKDITHTARFFVIEFKLTSNNIVDPRALRFRMSVQDDTNATTQFYIGENDNGIIGANSATLRIPVFFSQLDRPQKIQIEWVTNATYQGGTLDITNLKFMEAPTFQTSAITSFLTKIIRNSRGLKTERYLNGSKLTIDSTIPNYGTWKIGDIVKNSVPTASNPIEKWLRVTDGSTNVLGTDWVSK